MRNDLDDLFNDALALKNNAYNTITNQIGKGLNTLKPSDILDTLTALSRVIEAQNELIQTLYAIAKETEE